MLRNLSLNLSYNTSEHNISKDFYEPIFSNAIQYKRGVGYFTSGWLNHNAVGLATLIENGGTIQFITSPILDKNDLDALEGKYDADKINTAILKNVDELAVNLEINTRNLLGWLVDDGIIEFKFAIPKNDLSGGEFHDKFGIVIDGSGDYVAFNGSMNDSIKANYNYESISVFTSWGDMTSKVNAQEHLQRFDKLWEGKDPNLSIHSITDLVKKKLIKLKTSEERPYSFKKEIQKKHMCKIPRIPDQIVLRDYQEEAFNKWLENDHRGIFSMATGSGKTITAFSVIAKLSQIAKRLAVVVVVPLQHLVEQWAKEAEPFDLEFVKCFESSSKWSKKLSDEITKFQLLQQNFCFIITTNSTYVTSKFQAMISDLKSCFLIVDEAHNFGSSEIRKKYIPNARYRLGLSATPDRYMDDEGTKAIKEYLGDIVFEYTLKQAIDAGQLTPYNYYPVLVYLTEQEQSKYIELSKKIASLMQSVEEGTRSSYLDSLLIERARIIAAAENKIPALIDLVKESKLHSSFYNLFYCAAKIDAEEDGAMRMVDKVNHALTDLGMEVENFTSFDSASKGSRSNLISELKDKIINGLVAIKCLDEGVDIPAVRRAFILSSSANPKEFIQRRGRVLRKAPGKELAEIYDFIVVPTSDQTDENYRYHRKYLMNELIRYREFSRLAKNYPQCEKPLLTLINEFNLNHI